MIKQMFEEVKLKTILNGNSCQGDMYLNYLRISLTLLYQRGESKNLTYKQYF